MLLSRDSARRRDPLYVRIAANVGELIEDGVLRTGDRIPSVRRASRQHRVSIATAVQAYLELENRGLIEARPKSGFFVRHRPRQLLEEPQTSRPPSGASAHETPSLISRLFDATMMRDVVQGVRDDRFSLFFGGIGIGVFGPLLVRLYCELMIVIFRINETLTDLRSLAVWAAERAHAGADADKFDDENEEDDDAQGA